MELRSPPREPRPARETPSNLRRKASRSEYCITLELYCGRARHRARVGGWPGGHAGRGLDGRWFAAELGRRRDAAKSAGVVSVRAGSGEPTERGERVRASDAPERVAGADDATRQKNVSITAKTMVQHSWRTESCDQLSAHSRRRLPRTNYGSAPVRVRPNRLRKVSVSKPRLLSGAQRARCACARCRRGLAGPEVAGRVERTT